MKKICVVTTTRAEYGLLKRVIDLIYRDEELELLLAVTGMHLSEEYGDTVQEIVEDGFPILERVAIMDQANDEMGILRTMSNAMERFGDFFIRNQPDLLVVLGDRYELMAICEAAVILKIPIAHISGGEITEGAIDDTVRHCITKMSQLHFPGCEVYRTRIIQLGEQPDRVFNYGDVGVENILKMEYMDKEELERSIQFQLIEPYACVTFHPTTLDDLPVDRQIEELLSAIECVQNMQFIFTGANADAGGKRINDAIRQFVKTQDNVRFYDSLGSRRYLSLLKNSAMVLGNSSSGIVEAPCFGIPTVNIGNRQKGRLQADSILNCILKRDQIVSAMEQAMTPEFRRKAAEAVNPYGAGNTSEQIVKEIKRYLNEKAGHSIVKSFYDIEGIRSGSL